METKHIPLDTNNAYYRYRVNGWYKVNDVRLSLAQLTVIGVLAS